MIAVGHTAVGTMIGIATFHLLPAPLWEGITVAGVVGLVSHYAMDLVPHGHYDFDLSQPTVGEKIRLTIDLVVPVGLALTIAIRQHSFSAESWLIGVGIAGAQLPDIVNGIRARGWLPKWKWLASEGRFHILTHWHNPADPLAATREGGRPLGWPDLWQVVAIAIAIILLMNY